MKQELEICVKALSSFNEILDTMINLGFHIQEDFQLNDIYMTKKNKSISLENKSLFSNYVLIRETVGKKCMIVIKNKKSNKKGYIIKQKSIKCEINNVKDGLFLMEELGYKKIMEIKDHNILLSNGINEIYLQNIEGLGTYLEIEQKNILLDNNNGNTLDEMIQNFNKYKLNVDKNNYFVKKSYDMLKRIITEEDK